jgi:hypothetical protein
MTAPHMLACALHCVARGWPVFPVDPTTNAPYKGSRGFKDATTNRTLIEHWWNGKPNSAIGVPTGTAFDVLDIDLEDFEEGVADLPDVEVYGPSVRSGGGKWHLYFKPTGLGRRIRFSKHCDWLGSDGYVIVPPSAHKSGGHYEWIWTPEQVELHDAPAKLVAFVAMARQAPPPAPPPSPRTSVVRDRRTFNPAGIIGTVTMAAEGTRNDRTHWAAWKVGENVRDGSATRNEGDDACAQIERAAILVGLSEREARAAIASGYRAGLEGRSAA